MNLIIYKFGLIVDISLKALIDDLREELTTQQTQSSSTNKQNQKRIEALLQQIQSSNIKDSGEEILLLKREVETAQKV